MPTALTITFSTDALNAFGTLPRRIVLDVRYTEDARPKDERLESSEPEIVARSVRVSIDTAGSTVIDLGAPLSNKLSIALLKSDGSTIRSQDVVAENGKAKYAISVADVKELVKAEADPVPTTSRRTMRKAQLVPIGNVVPEFGRSALAIFTVTKEAEIAADSPLGSFGFSKDRTSSVELAPALAQGLQAVNWNTVKLGVDGRFVVAFDQPLLKPNGDALKSLGWIWWLSGDRAAAGFVKDDVSQFDSAPKIIPLPAMQALPDASDAVAKDCDCDTPVKKVPQDVTEAELVNNPEVYSEDPGTFCKPFSNPSRVVSEKAFSVIARVDTPDISPLPSSRLRSTHLLDLEGDNKVTVATDPRGGSLVVMQPPTREVMMASLLNSKMPKRYKEPERVVEENKQLSSGRTEVSAQQPIQWEDDIAQYQAATVALGHILEFRVRTRSAGYSLGNVASTLTLAPRQTKRIQKVEFERVERARRDERTQQTDSVSDEVTSERDYNDTVAAYLSEWSTGSSSSGTAAAAGGFGFCIPPIVGGVGGGTSSAWSDSSQQGSRNTGASEQQRLRDAIRRHGDAVRRLQSTVVTEVTQNETVTGTTEVLRNANYGHSLTVIYYQILRHLKVSTEFAGVRECLFVPFAIKPFTLQRAYRWREAIQKHLRIPRFAKVMQHLRDVITDFEYSNMAPGTRANQRLTYMRGSFYLTMAIERPKDTEDGNYNAALWLPYSTYFGIPAYGIWAKLAEKADGLRDQLFQREHAPTIAAKWTDKLGIRVNGKPVDADLTLATRYGFNQQVRVDFNIPSGVADSFTRAQLVDVQVEAKTPLPPGSVANVSRMTIRFGTANFERTIEALSGVDDLVTPDTGAIDDRGAQLTFPLDAWDNVNEREVLRNSVNEFIEHLNEHVEFYHKAIWWSMDRDRLMMMLDGFYVPNSKNVSIASVVDREPIAIIGNSLVYRVGAGAFIGFGKVTTPTALYNQYVGREPAQDDLRISLPTDGLYAQTIMDECLALEEHQGTIDWVLNDPDPELGFIDPSLLASRRADQAPATTPTPFPSTIINLQNAPEAPTPSGLQGVLNAVTNPNAFRDMAGLAATQANALAALNTAAGLATNFGNQAATLELAKMTKSQEATRTADQKLATIQRAKEKGLLTDAEAAAQAKEVLASMNPETPRGVAPHENAAINSAIDKAKDVPGSVIEANTGEGAVKVSIGGEKEDSPGGPLIIDVNVTPALRTFGPRVNFTGRTKLSVKGKNLPVGTQLHWSIPSGETGNYTITQHVTASGISEVEISGIRPGKSTIGIAAIDSGVVIQSQIHELSIPQFVTVDDTNAAFNAFITGSSLQAIRDNIISEAQSVIDLLLLSEANVRLLWKSSGATVPAHIPASFLTTVTIGNTDPSGGYGSANPGPTVPNDVGDTVFDEIVKVFPGNYLAAAAGSDANQAVNDLVKVIAGIQTSDPDLEPWLIRFFGRLLGETMSHELYHTLLPVPFNHNVDGARNNIETTDIMDDGSFRSFLERTGITAVSSAPTDFIANLTDNTIATINKLTGASLAHIRSHFPVPPVPPFDK